MLKGWHKPPKSNSAVMLLVYQPSVVCCSRCIDIRMKVRKTNIHKHMSLMDDMWEDI
jgi:hypothetical protein